MALTEYLKERQKTLNKKLPEIDCIPDSSDPSEYIMLVLKKKLIGFIYDPESRYIPKSNKTIEINKKSLWLSHPKIYFNLRSLN